MVVAVSVDALFPSPAEVGANTCVFAGDCRGLWGNHSGIVGYQRELQGAVLKHPLDRRSKRGPADPVKVNNGWSPQAVK